MVEVSADGVDWVVVDATTTTIGDRTTITATIEGPADGWLARATFTNALGSATTAPVTLLVT